MDYFLLGLVVLSLIAFFSDALMDFIRDIQKYGIPLDTLLTIVGLQLPKTIALVLPASCFMAVLMAYNMLNNNLELITMRMNGISLRRLIKPALILGAVCSLAAYVLYDHIVPYCNAQTERLKEEAISRGTLPYGRESFMYKAYDGNHNLLQMIYVGNYEGRKLGDSTIIDLSKREVMQVIQAKSGLWHPDKGWKFNNANIYVVAKSSNHSSAGHSETFFVQNLLNKDKRLEKQMERAREIKRGIKVDSDAQSFWELFWIIKKREQLNMRVASSSYLKMWEKITFPLSCVVMILSAVALAMTQPRQGNQRGFIFSLGVLFLFYVLLAVAEALGKAGVFTLGGLIPLSWSLMLASWTPVVLMIVLGVGLLVRKSRVL